MENDLVVQDLSLTEKSSSPNITLSKQLFGDKKISREDLMEAIDNMIDSRKDFSVTDLVKGSDKGYPSKLARDQYCDLLFGLDQQGIDFAMMRKEAFVNEMSIYVKESPFDLAKFCLSINLPKWIKFPLSSEVWTDDLWLYKLYLGLY